MGIGLVAVVVVLLGGASVPGWLLLLVVVTAMPWGVAAGVEQKAHGTSIRAVVVARG